MKAKFRRLGCLVLTLGCQLAFGGDEGLFPRDFDPAKQFTPYSFKNLQGLVATTFGSTNAYDGQKAKVFANSLATMRGNVNPVLRNAIPANQEDAILRGLLGPRVDVTCVICDRTWQIFDADNKAFFGAQSYWDQVRSPFNLYLAFPSKESFQAFLHGRSKACTQGAPGKRTPTTGCYIAAAGTLGHERADFHASLAPFGPGEGRHDVPYLLVEKIEIYQDSAWAEHMTQDELAMLQTEVTAVAPILYKLFSLVAH